MNEENEWDKIIKDAYVLSQFIVYIQLSRKYFIIQFMDPISDRAVMASDPNDIK